MATYTAKDKDYTGTFSIRDGDLVRCMDRGGKPCKRLTALHAALTSRNIDYMAAALVTAWSGLSDFD